MLESPHTKARRPWRYGAVNYIVEAAKEVVGRCLGSTLKGKAVFDGTYSYRTRHCELRETIMQTSKLAILAAAAATLTRPKGLEPLTF